ncbi:hypothetical protein [Sphingomonas abaci]|uniref:Uncharacterized protein n=1 Tax=Sphingomonas abaci TaxID=237611 RepID=A0A7W7AMQ9_9SPHN|nr:hypothetical protein [Sphingomonas abaci]MBB4618990.1 hypothetical protein [Sphingomonas abaci]
MSGPFAAWALGVACIAFMGGYAVYALWVTIAPNRAKIAAAIAPVLPRFLRSPAASGTPHVPAPLPQLRRVEAAAEPAIQVRP